MGGSGPFGESSGGAAPIAVENFHLLRDRQTTDTIVAPADKARGSTCSTGTARAAPRGCSRRAETTGRQAARRDAKPRPTDRHGTAAWQADPCCWPIPTSTCSTGPP